MSKCPIRDENEFDCMVCDPDDETCKAREDFLADKVAEQSAKISMTQRAFNKLMDDRYQHGKDDGISEAIDQCIEFVEEFDEVIADYLRDAFKEQNK